MSKTLITWPHGSTDGASQAKLLQARYPAVSEWRDGGDLGSVQAGAFKAVIIVGHRSEIKNGSYHILVALGEGLKKIGAEFVVLAACSSGTSSKNEGTLGNNELWEPAQVVANYSGAVVAATSRALWSNEVADSLAFTAHAGYGITVKEPEAGKQPDTEGSLWKTFRAKDPVDDLADALSKL